MSNLMSKIYIGYVVEVIKKNNKPTLELRVRVPSIHGVSSSSGVADKDLPIAKPLITPGLTINSLKFTEFINNLNKVYVIFESGNFNNPVYLGVKGNSDIYDIPIDDEVNSWLDLFNITNPKQDQILVYNNITGKFENRSQEVLLPEFHYVGSTRPVQDIKIWIQINDDEIDSDPEMRMLFNTFGIPIIDDTQEDLEVTMFKSSEITNNELKPFKIKLKKENLETKDSQENIEQNNVNNKTKIKLNNNVPTSLDNTINNKTKIKLNNNTSTSLDNTINNTTKIKLDNNASISLDNVTNNKTKIKLDNNASTSLDNTTNNTTNNTVVTKIKLGKTQRGQFNKEGQLVKHSNIKFRFNTVNKTNKIHKVSKKIKLNERKV